MLNSIKGVLLLVLISTSLVSCGTRVSKVPNRLVNDEAVVLSVDQRNTLETKLVAFSNTNGTQIAVLTRNGVKEELKPYCAHIFNTWGIGQKERNNGVLLFIDPLERNTYITTGTGTQVWLPDSLVQVIVDNQLIPAFKQGDYYEGIDDATDVIMDLAEIAYPSGK